MRHAWLASLSLLAFTSAASAELFAVNGQNYDVEFATGSGPNATVIVVDFGANAYHFGLRWDAVAPDGSEAIQAISAASGGSLVIHSVNFGFGDFVYGFEYNGDSAISDWSGSATPGDTADDYPNLWWTYWTSTTGSNWILPQDGNVGASDVVSENGLFQGWSRQYADWPPTSLPAAVAAVPEPASVSLLGLAVVGLVMRRRAALR